jgi:hypothetical protein
MAMACPEAKYSLKHIEEILGNAFPSRPSRGSLASKYLEYERGYQTRVETSVVALSTTPTNILAEAVDRWSWALVNPDLNIQENVWFDATVASNYGIVLSPGGGNASVDLKNDGMLTEKPVWAVAASGTPNIFVVEEVLI